MPRALLALLAVPLLLSAQGLPARTAVVELRIDGTAADLTRVRRIAVPANGVIAVGQPTDHLINYV